MDTTTDARLVLGYIRVSTDKQETERQQQTLPARHANLPDGLSNLPLKLFYDHGISAWSGKVRPGFDEMFERIERGDAAALIIDTSSRLTRKGIEDALSNLFTLRRANCRLFTTTGGEYTADLAGIIRLIVDADGDERYSVNLSHNTSTGKHANSSRGYWPHGKVPLGYVSIPAPDNPGRKVLTPSDDADAVREAFRLYDEEQTPLREIVRRLSVQVGHDYDRTFGRVLLENPTYIGKTKCDGTLYDGHHPALVSDDRFERVQRQLHKASQEHHRPPRAWPFARIARCAECGSTLRFKRQKQRYTYLYCTSPRFGAKTCGSASIPAALFEANVALYIATIARALRRHLHADPHFGVSEHSDSDLDVAHGALAAASEQFQTMSGLVIDRAITRDDPHYQQAKTNRDAAEALFARLSLAARSYRDEVAAFVESIEALDAGRDYGDHIAESYDPEPESVELNDDRFAERVLRGWLAADLETKRAVVARAFDKIVVSPENLTLHFSSALPAPLTLPVVLRMNQKRDRALAEADGFGNLRHEEDVSLVGTTPWRSPLKDNADVNLAVPLSGRERR